MLPAIIVILFGIFDFGRAFLTQHGLSAAAREGARVAIAARPVTDDEVTERIEAYLEGANIDDVTPSISPAADEAVSGDEITVSIEKEFTMSVLPITMTLRGTSVMVKE